jgi:hypothetical protein
MDVAAAAAGLAVSPAATPVTRRAAQPETGSDLMDGFVRVPPEPLRIDKPRAATAVVLAGQAPVVPSATIRRYAARSFRLPVLVDLPAAPSRSIVLTASTKCGAWVLPRQLVAAGCPHWNCTATSARR